MGVLYPHTPKLVLYSSFLPSFCQGIAPYEGVTPSRSLWGYYTPTPPSLLLYSSFLHSFCQGIAPKNFLGCAQQIFRALDNDVKLKFTNSGRHSLPSALIAQLRPVFCFDRVFCTHLFLIYLSSCQRLLFAPLDKGADVPLVLNITFVGV